MDEVRIPVDANWTTQHASDWLGGVTLLQTEAVACRLTSEAAGTYRELTPGKSTMFKLTLIPYYAWNNRGEPEMSVWIPLD